MLSRRFPMLVCAILLSFVAVAAQATNRVVVTTTADQFGEDAAHCSLREALYTLYQQTNFGGCTIVSSGLFNTVTLPAGTFVMTRQPVQGNGFAGGPLFIGENIVVQGAGAAKTIIDGGNLGAVFTARPGAGKLAGILQATVRNGLADATHPAGIDHQNGTLLLQQVLVTQNQGGYAVESNGADGVSLAQTTIAGNRGTGLAFYAASTGSVSIVNSTFSGNVSQLRTGGVEISANTNVTLTVNISNSTIAYNTGRADGQLYRTPGGLSIYGDAVNVYVRNSILARNFRGDRTPLDCDSDVHLLDSQGYNIIENLEICPFVGDTAHDIIGIAPQLAPLWDYGSGVPTHAVFPGTLAYRAGNPAAPGSGGAACESVDARNLTRDPSTRCDIGAYAYHADYVVTGFDDVYDPTLSDGECKTIFLCSLRTAIELANQSSTFTTIELPAGVMKLQRAYQNGGNQDGPFDISPLNAVTLVGKGAGLTTIDGGGLDTVIRSGALTTANALHGVTIRNGNGDALGGGIRVAAGNLLLDRSRVTGNLAEGGNGINVLPGTLLEIDESTIDHNRALFGLQAFGGGIVAQGTVRLFNSTVADNATLDDGGGIYNLNGDVSMAFTTVAGNAVPSGKNGAGLGGSGGLWHVTNSIIADNMTRGGVESDCAATLLLSGFTFIQDAAGCTIGGDAYYAASGDAKLSSLTLQGGTTPTIGASEDSPVIDLIGLKSECVDLSGNQVGADQRGVDRPDAGNWGLERCTVGAFQGATDVVFADGFE